MTTVKTYTKKPVQVKAMQLVYSSEGISALKSFCGPALGNTNKNRSPFAKGEAEILTLEDGTDHFKVTHIATEGDFIIQGVAGEFYACKPDIFYKTYNET